MSTVRLTMTPAPAHGLAAQRTVIDGKETPIVAGRPAQLTRGGRPGHPPGGGAVGVALSTL